MSCHINIEFNCHIFLTELNFKTKKKVLLMYHIVSIINGVYYK